MWVKVLNELKQMLFPNPAYKVAIRNLKKLSLKNISNNSSPDDLREWENNLKILRNSHRLWEAVLLQEKLLEAFPSYLEKHYPGDDRLKKYKKYKTIKENEEKKVRDKIGDDQPFL